MISYTLDIEPLGHINDEQFYQLCRKNPQIKFERHASGELVIMSPTGGETGNLNSEINADIVIWNRQTKLGKVFDSSTCFKLPNGANRSPDVAWISLERWNELTSDEKSKFPPITPDFVLELMSPSDNLQETQLKMQEYINNGARLGWLLNQKAKQVQIYRLGKNTEILNNPDYLDGEEVLPGFRLQLGLLWQSINLE